MLFNLSSEVFQFFFFSEKFLNYRFSLNLRNTGRYCLLIELQNLCYICFSVMRMNRSEVVCQHQKALFSIKIIKMEQSRK